MTDAEALHEWRQAAYQANRERDQARDRIAELEARLEVARHQGESGTAYRLSDLAGMYANQVARVRALHQPYRSVYDTDGQSCAHCNQLTGDVIPYPCDTIRAIEEQS
jgi:hypothetical protein